jgi:UDP-N-acetylglucosamine/UDP-N-acetylgalactosamine diphosphorylase
MDSLAAELRDAGQAALWEHAEQLAEPQRSMFLVQLREVDWRHIARLYQAAVAPGPETDAIRDKARRAQPPERLIRLDDVTAEHIRQARARGEAALRAGVVAAMVVAGGQGTRLGSQAPKGLLPIGPLSGKSLFQGFAEQVVARGRRYGARIPYLIMTSDATHADTVAFWREHGLFGLADEDVRFFCQGSLPAVDAATGRALLAAPGQLALSPDGHGGLLAALQRSGLLRELAARGIETLFYHQVDNPTTIVCDPVFLGWHLLKGAEVSTKVVAKRSAEEPMGVAVTVDGVTQIIEYSDLPREVAAQVDSAGRLRIWAGSTAIHAFQRDFLEQAAADPRGLPFHIARKVVPYWTPETGYVEPSAPNAFKFERFIFDVLPWARQPLMVEVDRSAEFNPVKNRTGADTPETARAAVQAVYRRWLREAGAIIGDDVPIEISPLVALDVDEVRAKVAPGTAFTHPVDWSRPGE